MRDRTVHSGVTEDPRFVERDCISPFVSQHFEGTCWRGDGSKKN